MLTLAIALSAHAAEVHDLSLALPEGRTMRMVQSTHSTTEQGAMTVVSEQEVTSTTAISVAEDGSMKLGAVIDAMKVVNKAGDQVVTWESASGAAPDTPELAIYGSLVGTRLDTYIDGDFNVVRVEGMDAMVDKMVAAMPGLDEASEAAIREELKAGMGDDAMPDFVESATNLLPAAKVPVGERWSRQVDAPSLAGTKTTMTFACTLAGVRGELADIDCTVTGTMDYDSDALVDMARRMSGEEPPPEMLELMKAQLGTMEVEKVGGTAEMTFDTELGLGVAGSSTIEAIFSLGGQRVATTAVSDYTVTVVEP